jgi:hypothetical protein
MQEAATETVHLTGDQVVECVYKDLFIRNNAQPITFSEGPVETLIDEYFDSYEGGRSTFMSYGKADLFSLEGWHYALALGRGCATSGRMHNPFSMDIALLAVRLPRAYKNPILRFFLETPPARLERDLESEIAFGLHNGRHLKNTIVAVEGPGLLRFNRGLFGGPFHERASGTNTPRTSVQCLPYAAWDIRREIELDVCPGLPGYIATGAERTEKGSLYGKIKYHHQIVTSLADSIVRAIKIHARARKK